MSNLVTAKSAVNGANTKCLQSMDVVGYSVDHWCVVIRCGSRICVKAGGQARFCRHHTAEFAVAAKIWRSGGVAGPWDPLDPHLVMDESINGVGHLVYKMENSVVGCYRRNYQQCNCYRCVAM